MIISEDLENRVRILVNAAKYDVSCSSSGSDRAGKAGQLGSAVSYGICHSFTQDGRCISLLKILLSNKCSYNCEYCLSRASSNCERAEISPDELCQIVMEFYKRNYIEGLFLSSAVQYNPNYTMERLTETVIKLRKVYGFNGYIHLKGIPGADVNIAMRASYHVDRMSFNIELPSEKSLKLLAPQKRKEAIIHPMSYLAGQRANQLAAKGNFKRIIPAGQTTQMIVGASNESDGEIIRLSSYLYNHFDMKRVYYSNFIPVTKSPFLPDAPQPLLREHRLYQADWLIRVYGFRYDEVVRPGENLPLDIDPKAYWAMKNPSVFPVEVNTAPYEVLLRTPGIGFKSAYKIYTARKYTKLTFEDLRKMRVVLKRAIHFITCDGKYIGQNSNLAVTRKLLADFNEQNAEQLSLFSTPEVGLSALIGEV